MCKPETVAFPIRMASIIASRKIELGSVEELYTIGFPYGSNDALVFYP